MKNEDLKLAMCRINDMPTSMFFEEFEELSLKEKKQVLALCNSCSVKQKCLDDALANRDTYGVWGGQFFKKGRPIRINIVGKSKAEKASA
jgi:hypothetical protein